MTDETLLIWDEAKVPANVSGRALYWRNYTVAAPGTSIPQYVEDHADRLRAKYLSFIHDLGESRVNGRSVIDHLAVDDDLSLWWMTELAEKSPLKCPRIYDCLRLLALEELAGERKPLEIHLLSADSELADAVRCMSQNLGLRFSWRRTASSRLRSFRAAYESLPAAAQGIIVLLRHIFQRWGLRRTRHPRWFDGPQAVCLFSYFVHLDNGLAEKGQFHSRQWETLPGLLHAAGRPINWIHHFLFSAAVPNLRMGRRWLNLFNSDSTKLDQHAFLDAFLRWDIVCAAFRRWLLFVWRGWRFRQIRSIFAAQNSNDWLWPILRRDWQLSLTGPVGVRNCLWIELLDRVFREIPHQALGLFLWEGQGWEQALLWAWRKHGHGRIVGVQHATVAFWHLQNFSDPRTYASKVRCGMLLPDQLAVNGVNAWRAMADSGFPQDRLVEVEALRYLHLGRMPHSVLARADGPIGLQGRKVLVLGDIAIGTTRSLLDLLMQTAPRLPSGFQFTFKPHPAGAFDSRSYAELRMGTTSAPLAEVLSGFDMAVASNSTSAAVDALLSGLRVIVVLECGALNLSPLRGQPGVTFVADSARLMTALCDATKVGVPSSLDFFHLDPQLPRWRMLLSLGNEAGKVLAER